MSTYVLYNPKTRTPWTRPGDDHVYCFVTQRAAARRLSRFDLPLQYEIREWFEVLDGWGDAWKPLGTY